MVKEMSKYYFLAIFIISFFIGFVVFYTIEDNSKVQEKTVNEASGVNYDFVVITASWCPFSSNEQTMREISELASYYNDKISSREDHQFWTKGISLDWNIKKGLSHLKSICPLMKFPSVEIGEMNLLFSTYGEKILLVRKYHKLLF